MSSALEFAPLLGELTLSRAEVLALLHVVTSAHPGTYLAQLTLDRRTTIGSRWHRQACIPLRAQPFGLRRGRCGLGRCGHRGFQNADTRFIRFVRARIYATWTVRVDHLLGFDTAVNRRRARMYQRAAAICRYRQDHPFELHDTLLVSHTMREDGRAVRVN